MNKQIFFLSLIIFFALQGGPHNHTIGGLAVCLKYAQSPEFKAYQENVRLLNLHTYICDLYDDNFLLKSPVSELLPGGVQL